MYCWIWSFLSKSFRQLFEIHNSQTELLEKVIPLIQSAVCLFFLSIRSPYLCSAVYHRWNFSISSAVICSFKIFLFNVCLLINDKAVQK